MPDVAKWDILEIVCGECGSEMHVKDGRWGYFFACTKYPVCCNRMNPDLYEKIMDKILELMNENPGINLTNFKWTYKTPYQCYNFKIRKHRPDKFLIEVSNVRERGKKAKI